uniref:G protein-coupled receptor n=1 Tax=Panagrolaimus davidi TaxID=227884 RepID=A0A914PLQ6_9BILA
MYAGDMPKAGPAAIVASWSEYYGHRGDSNETRFGNLIHMNFMVFYMCYIALIAILVGYSLLIFSAMKIFHVLKKHQSTLSRRTLELQKALAMSLIVQASSTKFNKIFKFFFFQSCVPILFVGIPLIIIISTVATGTYSPLINSIAMLIFSYQILLSPLISFYFVRPYRRILSPKGFINLLNSKISSKRVHSEVAVIHIHDQKSSNHHHQNGNARKGSTNIEIS